MGSLAEAEVANMEEGSLTEAEATGMEEGKNVVRTTSGEEEEEDKEDASCGRGIRMLKKSLDGMGGRGPSNAQSRGAWRPPIRPQLWPRRPKGNDQRRGEMRNGRK